MAKLITHKFVSTIPDGDDASLVKPSNWNDTHDVSGVAESGANSDITSLSGITGGISSPDYIQFDTTYATPLTAGQLGWDGNDTLGLGMIGGNVVQKIGEDTFFYVKASSAITKGQLCMFTGAVGSSGVVTAAPATAIPYAEAIIGVAAENIANNAFGLIQNTGTLKGVDTSAFLDGDILYYNSAVTGGFTKTFPTSGPIVIAAAVAKAGSGGSGILTIRISFQTRVTAGTGMSVTQGNDVVTITNTSPSSGGTVTSITAGTGLSGGTITTSGTIAIDSTVATLTGTQALTNKTISVDDNTVSGIAASSFVLSNGSGNIDGAAAQKAIPTGVVVGTTDTQTLTNKRVTNRIGSNGGTTSGNITPTSDTADQYNITGLTGTSAIQIPSGTPTDGQRLSIRIKDNGTGRTLSWVTTAGGYRVIGSTLPLTTTANKTIYVGCVYNSADSFWDVVAVASEV
jgi:hypothetical protein